MPLADSGGPGWIRKQRARTEERWRGLGLVREFLASLFGGSRRPARTPAAGPDDEPGSAGSGVTAPLVPPRPTLTGSNARTPGDD